MSLDFQNAIEIKEQISEFIKKYILEYNDNLTIKKEQLSDKIYIKDNIDKITKIIINQYVKLRFLMYIMDDKNPMLFDKISKIEDTAPMWMKNKFKSGTIYKFDINKVIDYYNKNKENFTQIVDYLYFLVNEYIEKELEKENTKIHLDYLKHYNKISTYEKLVHLTKQSGEKLFQKKKNKQIHNQALTKVVMSFPDGYKVLQLLNNQALEEEGIMMKSCVGSGDYTYNVFINLIQIYSLRDAKNKAHVTFEVVDNKYLFQAKGHKNFQPKAKYAKYCADFLNYFNVFVKCPDLVFVVEKDEHSGLYKPCEDKKQAFLQIAQNQR